MYHVSNKLEVGKGAQAPPFSHHLLCFHQYPKLQQPYLHSPHIPPHAGHSAKPYNNVSILSEKGRLRRLSYVLRICTKASTLIQYRIISSSFRSLTAKFSQYCFCEILRKHLQYDHIHNQIIILEYTNSYLWDIVSSAMINSS